LGVEVRDGGSNIFAGTALFGHPLSNYATKLGNILRPLNAATEVGNGTIRVSTVANGSFTVTHANNAQTDRMFLYAALG